MSAALEPGSPLCPLYLEVQVSQLRTVERYERNICKKCPMKFSTFLILQWHGKSLRTAQMMADMVIVDLKSSLGSYGGYGYHTTDKAIP